MSTLIPSTKLAMGAAANICAAIMLGREMHPTGPTGGPTT